ncbi:MAG: hypothetical protein J7497_13610, partial [Chitinophagaceae bacterium]|nr:hypothetical protein [Chitinophagaceae bacterium]
MKKLLLVLAVLATGFISLVSFKKSTTPTEPEKKQVNYYWVRYGCQAYGASAPLLVQGGQNFWTTTETGIPAGNCPENSATGVCA